MLRDLVAIASHMVYKAAAATAAAPAAAVAAAAVAAVTAAAAAPLLDARHSSRSPLLFEALLNPSTASGVAATQK